MPTPPAKQGSSVGRLLLTLDLAGSLVFAVEGGAAAAAAHLDLLGVLIVAFSTALGGGIIRDVLLGATPPAALRDARYALSAFLGGAIVIVLARATVASAAGPLLWLDAAGLALFAIAGAEKALDHGLAPLLAILLGAVSGAGGGVLRDLLLNRVPLALHADIYAVAAIAGATAMVLGRRLGLQPAWAALVGAVVCFGLRALAILYHLHLAQL